MSQTLYIANISPDTTADDLRAMFSQHGDVETAEIAVDERSQQPVGRVLMSAEKHGTRAMNKLNGTVVDGRRIAVTPEQVDLSKALTAKQRKFIQQIVDELEESEKVPLRQIETLVRFCGPQFVQALLDETLELEAGDGLMTSDGSRRRSKGGVFFYLARYRIAPELRRLVYNRKGKVPGEQYD